VMNLDDLTDRSTGVVVKITGPCSMSSPCRGEACPEHGTPRAAPTSSRTEAVIKAEALREFAAMLDLEWAARGTGSGESIRRSWARRRLLAEANRIASVCV